MLGRSGHPSDYTQKQILQNLYSVWPPLASMQTGTFCTLSTQDEQEKPEEHSAALGLALAHATSLVLWDGAEFSASFHLIHVQWAHCPVNLLATVRCHLSVGSRHAGDHQLGTAWILICRWTTHVPTEQWSKGAASPTPDEQHGDKAAGSPLYRNRFLTAAPLILRKPGVLLAVTVAGNSLFLWCERTMYRSRRWMVTLGRPHLGGSTTLPMFLVTLLPHS